MHESTVRGRLRRGCSEHDAKTRPLVDSSTEVGRKAKASNINRTTLLKRMSRMDMTIDEAIAWKRRPVLMVGDVVGRVTILSMDKFKSIQVKCGCGNVVTKSYSGVYKAHTRGMGMVCNYRSCNGKERSEKEKVPSKGKSRSYRYA